MMIDLSPLWISLKIAILSTIITLILGILTAYKVYNIKGRLRTTLESIFLIPLILPPTVVGFILLIILGKNGIFAPLINYSNISLLFTWYSAVIVGIVISFPLMFRVILGAFEQINPFLLDTARLEGAKEIAVFYYIALPLAMRGILSGIILSFTRILGEFGATLIVAGNIPKQTQTIPMAIYFSIQGGETFIAIFWVIIMLIFAFITVFIINNLIK